MCNILTIMHLYIQIFLFFFCLFECKREQKKGCKMLKTQTPRIISGLALSLSFFSFFVSLSLVFACPAIQFMACCDVDHFQPYRMLNNWPSTCSKQTVVRAQQNRKMSLVWHHQRQHLQQFWATVAPVILPVHLVNRMDSIDQYHSMIMIHW